MHWPMGRMEELATVRQPSLREKRTGLGWAQRRSEEKEAQWASLAGISSKY